MPQLMQLAKAAVPAALEKALRYRLLNEPREAESICLDVLEIDPQNQSALITLLLARTDLIDVQQAAARERAEAVLPRLEGAYEQAYYEGLIVERWAKSQLGKGLSVHAAAGWLRKAMRCYERARELSRDEDPDPVLRWNTCARMLMEDAASEPEPPHLRHDVQTEFGDEMPPR